MKISDLDIHWSAERVHEIVIGQFPQFSSQTPELLGRGWDNVCVLYPDQTVFRLPTRQVGGEIMATECAILPKIRPFLSLNVPQFEYFGKPVPDYSWPFVGYKFLPGAPSETLQWTAEDREKAALVLGAFLKGLHQIPPSTEVKRNLPLDTIARADSSAILRRISNYLSQIDTSYPPKLDWAKEFEGRAMDLAKDLTLEPKLVITHGDLYPRHILANVDREVTGIIDWGDIHLGHPSLDLSIAYTFFTRHERESFWAAYGMPVDASMKAMGQLRAINYILALYLYGRHSENSDTLSMVRQMEENLNS